MMEQPHSPSSDDDAEPEFTPSETASLKAFDRAYKKFWKKRGKEPPSVSCHWIMYPEDVD